MNPEVLTLGRLEVNVLTGHVRRAGVALRLSEVERKLLAAVASHAPAVVSRQTLDERLWPEGRAAGSRALDMAWARLRKRLSPDADDALKTVRGVGFALMPGAAPPPTRAVPPEIPSPRTPFIGFARELAQVSGWIRQRSGGWLTVTGAGGAGKTRLATEAAHRAAREGGNPIWIDLAPLGDGDAVLLRVADRLGVDSRPGSRMDTALTTALAKRTALLFLDNMEHVPQAADRLGAVLSACPGIRVVATSRRVLRVPGERITRLDGLDPAEDAPALYVSLVHAFLVAPNPEALDPELIHAVCEASRGHPLTIELAVATLRRRPPAALLAMLRVTPARLRGERSGRAERHASFSATFEYSWGLLDGEARLALASLALLAGPFDEAYAAWLLGVGPAQIVELVEQSLLGRAPGGLALHPLIWEVAREKLADLDPGGAVEARFRRTLLAWLGHVSDRIRTEDDLGVIETIDRRLPDLAAAWRSAVVHRDETAMAAAWPGVMAWVELREQFSMGRDWCQQAVEVVSDADLRADLTATLGLALIPGGLAMESTSLLSAAIAQQATRAATRVRLYLALAVAHARLGDRASADAALATASELVASLEDPDLHAQLHIHWGGCHREASRSDLVGAHGTQAIQHARAGRNAPLLRRALILHGSGLIGRSRFAEALTHAEEAHTLAMRAGDGQSVRASLNILALALRYLGRFEDALAAFIQLREWYEAGGIWNSVPYFRNQEASVLLELGRFDEAEGTLELALQLAEAHGRRQDATYILLTLCNLHLARGRYEEGIAVARRRRALTTALSPDDHASESFNGILILTLAWLAGDQELARAELRRVREGFSGEPPFILQQVEVGAALVEARDGHVPEAAAAALTALQVARRSGDFAVRRTLFPVVLALTHLGHGPLAASILPVLCAGAPLLERWIYLSHLERALEGVTSEARCGDLGEADARVLARLQTLAPPDPGRAPASVAVRGAVDCLD